MPIKGKGKIKEKDGLRYNVILVDLHKELQYMFVVYNLFMGLPDSGELSTCALCEWRCALVVTVYLQPDQKESTLNVAFLNTQGSFDQCFILDKVKQAWPQGKRYASLLS